MSDTRYRAVRTENAHLKGMMGDLDPRRYMVMCWRRSVAWTESLPPWPDAVYWMPSTCQACRSQADKVSHTWMEFTFILQAGTIWISGFLLVLFLNWAQFKLFPQTYITVLAFASGLLTPCMARLLSVLLDDVPLRLQSEQIVPAHLGQCVS